jgi:cyclic-di-AMP phosphodiesterase PgpH
MASRTNKPNRWVAPAPKTPIDAVVHYISRRDVWIRIGLCVATGLVLWLATSGWQPGFPYRIRRVPLQYPHARVEFRYVDQIATSRQLQRVRRTALVWYANDTEALNQLRQALIDRVFQLRDKPWESVSGETWREFLGERFAAGGTSPPTPDTTDPSSQDQQAANEPVDPERVAFERFVAALKDDTSLENFKKGLEAALQVVSNGLLRNLEHEFGEGSTESIMVFPQGRPSEARSVKVSEVRIGELTGTVHERLKLSFASTLGSEQSDVTADRVYDWLIPRLPVTLRLDQQATELSVRRAESNTPDEYRLYSPGNLLDKRTLSVEGAHHISAGVPLQLDDIALLRAEHQAYVDGLGFWKLFTNTLASWGMYTAVFTLLCGYLFNRERRLLANLRQFSCLLFLFAATVIACHLLSIDPDWRAEIIPVCMVSILVAIAWHRELALLVGALVALVFTLAHGYGMDTFVTLAATSFSASLPCGRIRSRSRIVHIGLIAAAAAFPTTIGAGISCGQPLLPGLILDGLWYSGGAILAGMFMTAVLPFLEKWFGIQTDISFVELSDANHPLLRQLVQRAPGTYNHSINVASLAESAAEAIGANGLVCRVGAYFHDIGKMRKPEYFVENQSAEENKHNNLVPTMSTLVIIAHVKDGVEMARQHYLPGAVLDIIQQHHGTTLVEYFFHQATRRSEESGDPAEVPESDFRYPGPRPQTPEAAVVMLADAVESASRSLRDPTPARLEGLVHTISKKKLDDGQFDECSITLQQLRIIEDSLVKSLNAMYHARVKYPDQQPA